MFLLTRSPGRGGSNYLLIRWMIPRLPILTSSLVVPMAQVCLEFLNSQGGGGPWNATAYTQYGFTPLTQLTSVIALWGITLLIYWWTSIVNNLISIRKRRVQTSIMVYAGVMTMVVLCGSVRSLRAE